MFKRCGGSHATLWPFDLPFPGDDDDGTDNGETNTDQAQKGKRLKHSENNGYAGEQHKMAESTTTKSFSIQGGAGAGLQYPAYFKDAKGNNHSVFGSNLGSYLKQGQKGMLPDVLQQGRNAGMPLYVRCPICQKEFKQKSTLLQHGCIHIESRPYPCPECGKRFRQQSHLTQHLRIHTNEKPYGCIYCPRFFRQRTILNQVNKSLTNNRLAKIMHFHFVFYS